MQKINIDLPKMFALVVKTAQLLLVIFIVFSMIMFFIIRSHINTATIQLKDDLLALYSDDIEVAIDFDESVPVNLAVPIGELLDMGQLLPEQIPLNTSVPIQTTIRINQTVNVPVDLPMLGRTMVTIPIDMNVPIDQNIPVNTVIDIDPSAFHDPDRILYIDQDIAINIPLEVGISIKDLGLQSKFAGVESLIDTLRLVFLLEKLEWSQ